MKESARELLRNGVKDKLARNEVVLSMTVRLVRTVDIAAIARTAGFDSIYIDVEHSSFSLDTTGQICMAALAAALSGISTKPKPLERPVSRSVIILTLSTTPWDSKSWRRLSSVALNARLPTKIFTQRSSTTET